MQGQVEVGQFWIHKMLPAKVAEIVEITKNTNRKIEAKVRVWVQTKPDHLFMLKNTPIKLEVDKNDFHLWKLIDIKEE